MITLGKMISRLYEQEENPRWTADEYEEMFWMMYYGIRPCEWDGREIYVPEEYVQLYKRIKEEEENICAWEIFDDEGID